ncbi:major tail protein [Fictibacillus sp. JL2B1089]|uniref:major tail protein n=1 Tax=Fictibacillus sp. JL2B1089 TaxID=3399565 RepID=UPI003A8A3D49
MTVSKSGQVGLKKLHFALQTKDDSSAATYDVPELIAPAVNVKITPKTDSVTDYGDDGAVDTASALGEIDVEIETTSLPLDIQAKLLGHKYQNGLLVKGTDDIAPYVAIGFEAPKSDGSKLFVWLYKGKFDLLESEHKTKQDKVEFQHPKLKAKFVRREFDKNWQVSGDTSDTAFTLANTWFTKVIAPADATAPQV